MGVIYIYTFSNKKQYVGQTTQKLSTRKAQHLSEAKLTPEKGCIALNNALRHHKYIYELDVLIECEDYDLDIMETAFIVKYNTLVPNGYNIKIGGSNAPHSPDIIAKRAKSLRKKDHDLPMYTKSEMKHGKLTWRINNHPKCSNKNFDTKEEMLKFLTGIEDGSIQPIIATPKAEKKTPKGIQKSGHGYVIAYKGKYLSCIKDKKKTLDELLEIAIEELENLKKNGTIEQ